MPTKVINISLPEDFLAEVDEAAAAEQRSRSDFFRQAAREYLARRPRWMAGPETLSPREMDTPVVLAHLNSVIEDLDGNTAYVSWTDQGGEVWDAVCDLADLVAATIPPHAGVSFTCDVHKVGGSVLTQLRPRPQDTWTAAARARVRADLQAEFGHVKDTDDD